LLDGREDLVAYLFALFSVKRNPFPGITAKHLLNCLLTIFRPFIKKYRSLDHALLKTRVGTGG
jgi:hypothetical protein